MGTDWSDRRCIPGQHVGRCQPAPSTHRTRASACKLHSDSPQQSASPCRLLTALRLRVSLPVHAVRAYHKYNCNCGCSLSNQVPAIDQVFCHYVLVYPCTRSTPVQRGSLTFFCARLSGTLNRKRNLFYLHTVLGMVKHSSGKPSFP